MRTFRIRILLCALMAMAVGCTANKQYRTNYTISGHSPDSVIEVWDDCKLGVVEFDDQGCYWDTRQRDAVEKMIETEAGIGQPIQQRHGIVLVVFVHGWKDNADFNDGTLVAFRGILSQMKKGDPDGRKVVGVYVGWRGLSSTVEPFKELSFWGRKDTAFKVGGYGALTKLLVDLENLQARSLAELPDKAPRTELITIGHSFGGAAVFASISQILSERFINTVGVPSDDPKHPAIRMRPLGDQVILLNPACEAMRFYDLNQLASQIESYPIDQRPVLSIFTSRSDWATHWMFPLGEYFVTLFQVMRPDEWTTMHEHDMQCQTIGWFGPFINHHLRYQQPPATKRGATTAAATQSTQDQRELWKQAHHKDTFVFYPCILEPELGKYKARNPFIIADVDPAIMNGHNDIGNQRMINFLWNYIQFAQPDVRDHSMYHRASAK